MTDDQKKALILAGKMADAASLLVGGNGLNGMVAPAPIWAISVRAEALRKAVEEYNEHITVMTLRVR